MNEAAGFIMDVPNSPYFAHTLRRAVALAERHSHRLATPEHLLMALLDDPDAKDMLEGARADMAVLRVKLSDVINRQMSALHAPGVELRPSLEFDRVLHAAAELSSRSPRRERDGAFVLAALVWEPEGPAASLLRQSGLSSELALAWLNAFRSSASQPKKAPRSQPKNAPAAGGAPMAAVPPAPPPAPPSPPANLTPEPVRPEPPRMESAPLRPEPVRHAAPRQESAEKGEETLEEMLARVRSILDDEDAPGDSPQRLSEAPPPVRPAPSPIEGRNAPAARAFHIRQHEAQGAPSPVPPLNPVPAPAPPMPGPAQAGPQPRGPAPAPERPVAAERQAPERQAPLPFGGLPRSPAPPPVAAPYRDPGMPPPIAPSRSLAPIPQPKPRSEFGKLVENIPRLMRVAIPERVEVRLSREETGSLLAGFEGRGELKSHNVILTRAMSVMLRAPDGGFTIENLSPETQWIVDRPSFLETEPFGRWRWLVTPTNRGEHKLLLIISARNVDEKGMIGDTPLPDQVIEVKVQANMRRDLMTLAQWAGLMIAGGVLTRATAWAMHLLLK